MNQIIEILTLKQTESAFPTQNASISLIASAL